MNIKVVLLLILSGLFTHSCFAQTTAERIDSFLAVMEQNQLFNGSVLVAKEGRVIYKRSYGYADRARKELNSDTAHFNLASLSKPFTALAILQLAQKGKIKLEDPFAKYLPGFPYPEITVHHLLTHTSGLPQLEIYERPYIEQHPDVLITSEDAYAHLVALKQPLGFPPGDKWAYSNIGYTCLALLVERVSRMPFGEYMRKYIFIPAGMGNTIVRSPKAPNTPRYTIPAMYTTEYMNVDSVDHTKFYTYYNLGGIAGAGNVVSTLEDLLRFDNALYAGILISPTLMDEAFKPVTLNDGKVYHLRGGNRSYGLGWNVIDDPGNDRVVFHDGHIVGIKTLMYRNLSKKITIIYYDNMDSPIPLDIVGTISRILGNRELRKISLAKSLTRIYGEALVKGGIDYAMTKFNQLKDDTAHYYVDESEMNALGYDLLYKADFAGHYDLSLEVFKINSLLYHSANSYDSYAEALMRSGKKEQAISMYKKSLLLKPDNAAGAGMLRQLLEQKK